MTSHTWKSGSWVDKTVRFPFNSDGFESVQNLLHRWYCDFTEVFTFPSLLVDVLRLIGRWSVVASKANKLSKASIVVYYYVYTWSSHVIVYVMWMVLTFYIRIMLPSHLMLWICQHNLCKPTAYNCVIFVILWITHFNWSDFMLAPIQNDTK